MGRFAVQFKCHHCNHCCTDVVCLPTPADVIRIVRNTGANPYDFLEFLRSSELTGVAKNDPTWLKCRGERYMMALRRDEIEGCYFLNKKTKLCGIYDARPILCRLYPFKLLESRGGEFKGFSLHADVGCPRNRDGVVPTHALYELFLEDRGHQEDYRTLVQVFNRKRYPGKNPSDFVQMFVEIRGPELSPA